MALMKGANRPLLTKLIQQEVAIEVLYMVSIIAFLKCLFFVPVGGTVPR